MQKFKYILERYKTPNTRYQCPSCNEARKFTRYINTETGEHLAANVGRCDREDKCGYHYTPKQYFQDNPGLGSSVNGRLPVEGQDTKYQKARSFTPETCALDDSQGGGWGGSVARGGGASEMIDVESKLKPASRMCPSLLNQSLFKPDRNNFIQFLLKRFGPEVTGELVWRYYVGTSKHRPGSTIFWQVDANDKVHAGKIILFNINTCNRVKEGKGDVTWVHSVLKQKDFVLQQCLFGEHLLKDKTKPIGLVESEKTAIIAAAHWPEYIWLATGGSNGFTAERCKALKDREVIVFPDLGCYDKWRATAGKLRDITNFIVSDLLERKANETDRKNGLDLADYLLRG